MILFWIEIIMPLLTFSDWDYNLFVKPIEPLTLVRGAATFDHDERIQPKF